MVNLSKKSSSFDLNDLTDEELLEKRVCELSVQVNNTILEDWIRSLYDELAAKQLLFRPVCYLADEWFVPTGATSIGIPFYLAHPRLIQLEKKMMLEVEGGTEKEFRKLIRHEAGHALYYAYGLQKEKQLVRIFGPSSDETPATYRPKTYSKNFVRHLPNWYAQCDADEDFAETFAVWCDPESRWKEVYAGWGALKKLEYVDALMNSLQNREPVLSRPLRDCSAHRIKARLKTYYQRRKKECEEDYPDFYDPDLKKIFSSDEACQKNMPAHVFMARNQKIMIDKIALWTGDKKYNISRLLKKLQQRCKDLSLYLSKNGEDTFITDTRVADTRIDVAAYLTSMITHHQLTGRFKRTV